MSNFKISGAWLTEMSRNLNKEGFSKRAYNLLETAFDDISKEHIKNILNGNVKLVSNEDGTMVLDYDNKKGEELIVEWEQAGMTRLDMVEA